METDNFAQQADEIEVLKSIYENEWTEDGTGSFNMKISKSVELSITLHPEYPSKKPPKYMLVAPYMTTEEKQIIYKDFKTLYEENVGSPIIYQWIEKLKEYTVFKSKKNNDEHEVSEPHTPIENKPKHNLERFSKIVVHGPTVEDRKSIFQGHVCKVVTEEDVRDFLEYLMENKKIAQATHNMYAYRLIKNSRLLQDCEDDGENHAGKRMLHLLNLLNLENVMVVVSRWYGGIQLGPDRFKHITNAARRALVQAEFIK